MEAASTYYGDCGTKVQGKKKKHGNYLVPSWLEENFKFDKRVEDNTIWVCILNYYESVLLVRCKSNPMKQSKQKQRNSAEMDSDAYVISSDMMNNNNECSCDKRQQQPWVL